MGMARTLPKALLISAFLAGAAYSPAAFSAFQYSPHQPNLTPDSGWVDPNTITQTVGAQGQNIGIQWPSDSIDSSQLQNLLSKFPGASQFNIQFPNQNNWSFTPDTLQNIFKTYNAQAQSVQLGGKLPDLSFSSLAMGAINKGMESGQLQLSVANLVGDLDLNGNIQEQLKGKLEALRYAELNLSDYMPEWMKYLFMAVYNAMSMAIDFVAGTLMKMRG